MLHFLAVDNLLWEIGIEWNFGRSLGAWNFSELLFPVFTTCPGFRLGTFDSIGTWVRMRWLNYLLLLSLSENARVHLTRNSIRKWSLKAFQQVLLQFSKEWESSFQLHSLIWKPEFPRSEDSILGNPILVIWFIRRKFFLNPPLVHSVREEYRVVWSCFLILTCKFVPLAYSNRRWKWAG